MPVQRAASCVGADTWAQPCGSAPKADYAIFDTGNGYCEKVPGGQFATIRYTRVLRDVFLFRMIVIL